MMRKNKGVMNKGRLKNRNLLKKKNISVNSKKQDKKQKKQDKKQKKRLSNVK